jgi:hypothetical protein
LLIERDILQIPMFARSKVWVGLFAAVVGSNHAGDIVICLVLVFRNVLFWVIMQQAAVVRNYHYSMRSNAEERSSQLLRSGNLKSCECFFGQVQLSATGQSLIQSSTTQ